MTRVVVFGGRRYRRYDLIFLALDDLKPTCVIHGDAPGADTGADVWAVVSGLIVGQTLLRFAAKWRIDGVYNPRAGHERNQRMIDVARPDLGLEFPGGTGTADMRRRLEAAGIPVKQGDIQ